jgi:hypothetical protein
MSTTAECIRDQHLAAGEALIAAQYASACNLLNAVNLDTLFPGVCTP